MTTPTSVRLSDELLANLEAKAEAEGCTRNELIAKLIDFGLENFGTQRLELSVSQIACMDQLAERKGVTRIELMRRWLSERLRREFTDDRNAKLQDVSSNGRR